MGRQFSLVMNQFKPPSGTTGASNVSGMPSMTESVWNPGHPTGIVSLSQHFGTDNPWLSLAQLTVLAEPVDGELSILADQ